jgi:hypothetical protein
MYTCKWGNVKDKEEVGRNQHEARRDGAVLEDKEGSEQTRRSLPFASLLGSVRNNADRLVKSESSQPVGPIMKIIRWSET